MKRFKYLSLSTLVTLLAVAVFSIGLSRDKSPDAGIAVFGIIGFGLLLMGAGLVIDLYRIFTRSNKINTSKHKSFWKIIAVLIVIAIFYMAYYSLAT